MRLRRRSVSTVGLKMSLDVLSLRLDRLGERLVHRWQRLCREYERLALKKMALVPQEKPL
jgi:hypothetical protein